MMDRTQPDQQAASQVGFLTGICLPCYSLLSALIPDTRPLLDQCRSNLERWKELDGDLELGQRGQCPGAAAAAAAPLQTATPAAHGGPDTSLSQCSDLELAATSSSLALVDSNSDSSDEIALGGPFS